MAYKRGWHWEVLGLIRKLLVASSTPTKKEVGRTLGKLLRGPSILPKRKCVSHYRGCGYYIETSEISDNYYAAFILNCGISLAHIKRFIKNASLNPCLSSLMKYAFEKICCLNNPPTHTHTHKDKHKHGRLR